MFLLPFLMSAAFDSHADLYIGTYTSEAGSRGIYSARLNTATGEIGALKLSVEADNPSFVALHPNGRYLYAVHERGEGTASAYAIGPDGTLRHLNTQSTGGADPCHLVVDPQGKRLYVANYSGGSVARYDLNSDGHLSTRRAFFQAEGSGPNHGRQEKPHMHCVETDPTGKQIYACDLGTDKVWLFDQELRTTYSGQVTPGGGPRHSALSKDGTRFYVNTEMGNAVTQFARDKATGHLGKTEELSTLPPDSGGNSSTAEILLHPSGKWLYVSNRGHDSVAVFSTAGGKLQRVQIAKTVATPRGMAIDPSGKWLVVGSQTNDVLVSMRIDPQTGQLGDPGHPVKLSRPVCVVFRR